MLGQRLEQIDLARFEGEPVELVNCSFRRWPSDELRRMARLIKDREIDLIHTHMSSAHFFGVVLRWAFGVPCVATAHCSRFQPHWRWNDFVIAVSQATYRFQRRYNLVPRRKLAVVYSAIDTKRFDKADNHSISTVRTNWDLRTNDLAIGVVGDIIARKGQLPLVRALPEILKKYPAAKLIIVGANESRKGLNVDESYIRQVRGEAESLGVAGNIYWHGYTRDIATVMRAIDVCVVPSLTEPFGLVAAEAMAARTPVLASKVGGLVDIITQEENGLLVPPNQPQLLAAQILRLLDDAALRHKLGECGRKSVETRFSVPQQLKEVQAIYDSVLLKRGKTSCPASEPATASRLAS